MSFPLRHIALCVFIFCTADAAHAQSAEFNGQASGWISAHNTGSTSSQFGARYIPDLLGEAELGKGYSANLEFSLNAYATGQYAKGEVPAYDEQLKLYRAWVRVSTDRFETRIGLQKISFGSALLFRPLMWFDRVDPRDPLQLTDGVYGLLARYFFQNNANIWLWGLWGNSDTKGWELQPTQKKSLEYGGRAQSPLWSGEIGLTYHHRRAALDTLISPDAAGSFVPEDRLGLDGKWDLGIGLWFESALIRQESGPEGRTYQRLWTIGADYTFSIGNGLYAAAEYFRTETPPQPFASGSGRGLSGLSLNYPIGVVDQVSGIFFHDWESSDWYRFLSWQRKYDNWIFYLMVFWNSESIGIYRPQATENVLAGTGFQLMIVFNH